MSTGDNESERQKSYNKMTDLTTGPNIRLRDNLFQLGFIVVSMILAAVICLLTMESKGIAIGVGALIGLAGGALISGLALGIYRTFNH